MGSQDSIVYVVDDDVRMRDALRELFASLNMSSAIFGSVAEYLAYPKPDLPGCLVLDVKLPDNNGLDFQRQLGDSYQMACEARRPNSTRLSPPVLPIMTR